jgi:hypothetical protein
MRYSFGTPRTRRERFVKKLNNAANGVQVRTKVTTLLHLPYATGADKVPNGPQPKAAKALALDIPPIIRTRRRSDQKKCFAAAHESAIGPLRRFAAVQRRVCFVGTSGLEMLIVSLSHVDPKRRFATVNYCIAKRPFGLHVGCLLTGRHSHIRQLWNIAW